MRLRITKTLFCSKLELFKTSLQMLKALFTIFGPRGLGDFQSHSTLLHTLQHRTVQQGAKIREKSFYEVKSLQERGVKGKCAATHSSTSVYKTFNEGFQIRYYIHICIKISKI